MQFLLLGIPEDLGATAQPFFDDLPEAKREAPAIEGLQLQPYAFHLSPVPAVREADEAFWPLCYGCGGPVQSRIGWVCYDDGRTYHAECDEYE